MGETMEPLTKVPNAGEAQTVVTDWAAALRESTEQLRTQGPIRGGSGMSATQVDGVKLVYGS